MKYEYIIKEINNSLELDIPVKISMEKLKEKISQHINYLIETNFKKLVTIVYRVDVSEAKLKVLLQENSGADAGGIIAELIIERQLQKIKSRREFRNLDKNISDEDKW